MPNPSSHVIERLATAPTSGGAGIAPATLCCWRQYDTAADAASCRAFLIYAAAIALDHHLGMARDPVGGLKKIPHIACNAFGAVKALAAASP